MNMNPTPVAHMLQAAEGYFAERMHQLIIIDMPRMASFLKDAVWPVVPEKTRQKVRFMTPEELREHLRENCDVGTAERVVESMEQNRDRYISLANRRKTWMR